MDRQLAGISIQLNTITGYGILDQVGAAMTEFSGEFSSLTVTGDGLHLDEPKDSVKKKARIVKDNVWITFSEPDTKQLALDQSFTFLDRALDFTGASGLERLGLRLEAAYGPIEPDAATKKLIDNVLDDRFNLGLEPKSDVAGFALEMRGEGPNQFNVTQRMRVVIRDSNDQYPEDFPAVMIDVDVYRRGEFDLERRGLRKFLREALDHASEVDRRQAGFLGF